MRGYGARVTGLLKEELQITSVNARRTLVQAVCREIEGLVSLRPPPRQAHAEAHGETHAMTHA